MRIALFASMVLAVGLSACSSQQLYGTGQAWRRSLCEKQAGEDRFRCLKEADSSYDEYRREVEASKAPGR